MSGTGSTGDDPRNSVRPLVAMRPGRHGPWLFGAAALLGGVILFATLDARRTRITAPAIGPELYDTGVGIASPPELTIPAPAPPPQSVLMPVPYVVPPVSTVNAMTNPPPSARPGRHHTNDLPLPAPIAIVPSGSYPPPPPIAPPSTPRVVYEAAPSRGPAGSGRAGNAGSAGEAERVEAVRFANPATTIPKGSVIQAVLESAFDSTRAGFARAIISRDVSGFDGTHVLIQRGSRLIGEYKADLAAGQSRALIQWQRLMRPDGVIINLDSPSADPLGRTGVEGKVHSHFAERFAGAMLQSALNVGTQVGVSKLTGGSTLLAIPLGQQSTSAFVPDKIQPTITVKQGTSVSVFVARDLDFTTVEQ